MAGCTSDENSHVARHVEEYFQVLCVESDDTSELLARASC